MCFVLYAGTTNEIPRRPFRKEAPDLSVVSLTERDGPIKIHFKSREVQYVGSTSGCGCDFPHATLHNGLWVDEAVAREHKDEDRLATENSNRLALVNLLKATSEPFVEVYGVWDGDFSEAPVALEAIALDQILDSNFYFKERGFYRVEISANENCNDSR